MYELSLQHNDHILTSRLLLSCFSSQGTSPRASVGPSGGDSSLPKAAHSKGDPDSKWKHDLFAAHNGISGGELGARLNGDMGRQVTSGAGGGETAVAKKAFQAALGVSAFGKKDTPVGQGLAIKGTAAVAGTTIEVDGLAPGTTAEDVAVSHIA
jgi:hypothetical protein